MILDEKESLTLVSHGLGFNCTGFFPFYHSHTFWEFMFIASPVLHRINGDTEILEPNTLVIIKPTDRHLITNVPGEDMRSLHTPTHMNLKATDAKLRELLAPIGSDLYDRLAASEHLTKKLHSDFFQPYNTLMSDLLWLEDETFLCPLISSTIVKIVNEFLPVLYKGSCGNNIDIPDIVKTMVYRMHNPQYFQKSIPDILGDTYYSHMQISRLFKKYMGKTMQEYFVSAKLKHAEKLLSQTEMKILDISSSLGFNSLSHFNHIFKDRYGIAPGDYRAANRSEENKQTNSSTV